MPTQCPECGGAGKVHAAKYDRTRIPTHERKEGDRWVATQTVAASNGATCRVCWGKGAL